MKKSIVAALLAAVLLAGCGSSAQTEQTVASETGAAETAAETGEAEASEAAVEDTAASGEGLTVADIQEKGVLTVGTDLTFEPYEYLDDEDNPTGYDVEIWQRVAEEMGVELKFEDLAFSAIFSGLEAGKFDVAGCCCNVTAERMEKYAFCYPVAYDEFYIVKRTGDDSISSVEDISGKTAGVELGTAPVAALEEFAAGLPETVEETAFSSSVDAFLALSNGTVDIACESYTICKQEVDASNGELEMVGSISTPVYVSFAFRKADQELCDYVSGVIKEMKEDGSLEELMLKYCGATYDNLPEDEAEYVK